MGFADEIRKSTDQVKQVLEALQSLEGEIVHFQFDPFDPASIQAAIDKGAGRVDEAAAPYPNNPMMPKAVAVIKGKLAEIVQRRAGELRAERGSPDEGADDGSD